MKVALITGAAQGIGRATALYLLEKNYHVVIADLDEEAGLELSHAKLKFIKTDVSKEKDIIALIQKSLDYFGHIDALINNAGIAINKPIQELSLEEWHKVLDTNLSSIFLCSKYAALHLKNQHGSIINIASTRALMSEANTEAYSASKGGILALTHALAISLGPDIRVNAISPGWIEVRDWQKASECQTPEHSEEDKAQHPVGRVGSPKDIASLVYYLLSDEASFITGQNFVVDGGMTKKMIYS